jgi:DNA mismatch repair protein MutS2
MTSRYGFDDLLASSVQKKAAPAPKPRQSSPVIKSDAPIPATMQTRYNTIDLRGLRVEEALIKLGNDLDAMTRSGISSVVIIHGHGTGAMKEAVRTALKSSPYISSFRRGGQGEGGDGVSIALLSR